MLTVSSIGELKKECLKEETDAGIEDSYLVKRITEDGERTIGLSAYGFTSAVIKAFPNKREGLFAVTKIHEGVPVKKVILFRYKSSTL